VENVQFLHLPCTPAAREARKLNDFGDSPIFVNHRKPCRFGIFFEFETVPDKMHQSYPKKLAKVDDALLLKSYDVDNLPW
jgi:hypothetical protein